MTFTELRYLVAVANERSFGRAAQKCYVSQPALSVAIQKLEEETVLAYEFEGRRYDCGNKLGYLEATVDYGLKHPELAADFAAFLRARGR